MFARVALMLLRLPPESDHVRLASVWEPQLESAFKEEIEQRLASAEPTDRLGGMVTLLYLAKKGWRWANEFSQQSWPKQLPNQLQILRVVEASDAPSWIGDKAINVILNSDRSSAARIAHKCPQFLDSQSEDEDWRTTVVQLAGAFDLRNHFEVRVEGTRFELHVVSIRKEKHRYYKHLASLPDHHYSWTPIIEASQFIEQPSEATLAMALKETAKKWDWNTDASIPKHDLPWPMATCLDVVNNRTDLEALAERVQNGELGNAENWLAAEHRWESQGLRDEDFVPSEREPFSPSIAKLGIPPVWSRVFWGSEKRGATPPNRFHKLFKNLENYTGSSAWLLSRRLLIVTLEGLTHLQRNRNIDIIRDIIETHNEHPIYQIGPTSYLPIKLCLGYRWTKAIYKDWLNLADCIGRINVRMLGGRQFLNVRVKGLETRFVDALQMEVIRDPDRLSLLRLLTAFVLELPTWHPELPEKLLDSSRYKDQADQQNAVLLSLAQNDWDTSSAPNLARRILDINDGEWKFHK